MLLRLTFISSIFGFAFCAWVDGATVTNTNDSGPGSLRQAITDTPAGGTVDFALTGCPCTIILTSGHLEVAKSLTILGPGADLLTISGGNTFRVFFLRGQFKQSRNMTLEGITVADGAPSDPVWPFNQGGGIYASGEGEDPYYLTVAVRNAKISRNRGFGGGVSADDTDLTIENSTISENDATWGGGAFYLGWFNKVRIKNSSIRYNTDSSPLYASTLYSINYNTVELENVTIEGNTVANGGPVIQNQWSTLTLINCTISGNSGRILNFTTDPIDAPEAPSLLTIANTTITQNLEGVHTVQGHSCCHAWTTVRNSIIARNGDDITHSFDGKYISEGYNFIGNAGTWLAEFNKPGDQAGTSSSPIDPLLYPLFFNGGPTRTHALKFNSPARDKGKGFGSATDQRGFERPFDDAGIPNAPGGDGSDIGSFESQFPLSATGTIVGRASGQGMAMPPRGYVILTDNDQNVRLSTINSFGYFVFRDVALERVFMVTLRSKGWTINPLQIFTDQSVMNLDLIAIRSP